jgi:hypothetical protein
VELDAYKCHVFLDWREVQDNEWHQYAHLADYLGGRGVPSIEEALQEVFLQPVHYPFKELVNAGQFRWLIEHRVTDLGDSGQATSLQTVLEEVGQKTRFMLGEMQQFAGPGSEGVPPVEEIAQEVVDQLQAALHLPVLQERFPLARSPKYRAAVEMVQSNMDSAVSSWGVLLAWLFTHALGKIVDPEEAAAQSRSWIDEWLLGKIVAGTLQDLGLDEGAAWWSVGVVKILVSHQDWFASQAPANERAYRILTSWLRDGEVQQFLQVNRHGGVLWFNRESFDQLLQWMLTIAAVSISADRERTSQEVARALVVCYEVIHRLKEAEQESGYQVVALMEASQPRAGSETEGGV